MVWRKVTNSQAKNDAHVNNNTAPLVTNGPVRATWLPGDRFWYRNQGVNGAEFILVDAAKGTALVAYGWTMAEDLLKLGKRV